MLKAAGADYSRWPLAVRCLNETMRLKFIGKDTKCPPFLSKVLVRKRFWRTKELLPTQEEVTYLGPSWVHHGHWVERPDGTQILSRMVMHGTVDPMTETQWVALEDQLSPLEERRRIRGKTSLPQVRMRKMKNEEKEGEEYQELVPDDQKEEEEGQEAEKVWTMIEEEMKHAMEDERGVMGAVLDEVAKVKQMMTENAQEEVLQTRIVSQAEVRRDIQLWKEPIQKELQALLETKEALRAISEVEVRLLEKEGLAEIIPAKIVYTLKPEVGKSEGKRKARIVACGNHSDEGGSTAELFAGGAGAVTLRIALSAASQRQWKGLVVDIRTAFLNAPMRVEMKENAEELKGRRAFLKPPTLLVLLKLVPANILWEVEKAVYGYRRSPRLWSDHRDDKMVRMKIQFRGKLLRMIPMMSEPNLWKIVSLDHNCEVEKVWGMMLVYVDDLMITGEEGVPEAVVEVVKETWELSKPEEIGSKEGVRFLGSEIWRTEDGAWYATQIGYTLDLLRRNLGKDESLWKTRRVPMVKEAEEEEVEEVIRKEDVREAQRIVGELVWLATRCRPDLSFATSKMASMISKAPVKVKTMGLQVWMFLVGTLHHGLEFKNESDEKELNVFTDSSFGERCYGCVIVLWGRSPLLWKTGKQPILSTSTAESELVEVMEGAVSGEAVRIVIEEAMDVRARMISYTDSASALAIVTGESGSWRTRHLRRRAHSLRERVAKGDWLVRHTPGTHMPADLSTKVLSADRFEDLKILMGMVNTDSFTMERKTMKESQAVEEQEAEEEVKKEEKDEKVSQKRSEIEKALKMIVLVAQIAASEAVNEGEEERAPEGEGLWMVLLAVVFVMGVLMGALLMAWFWGSHGSNHDSDSPIYICAPSLTRNQATTSGTTWTASTSEEEDREEEGEHQPRGSEEEERAPVPDAPEAAHPVASGSRRRPVQRPLYLTMTGTRYHVDPLCDGLRNAWRVEMTPRSPECGPHAPLPTQRLWSSGAGRTLHTNVNHILLRDSRAPVKPYTPCALCVLQIHNEDRA